MLGARPTAEDPDGSVCMRPNPHSKGYAGWALSWRWWRSLSAERPSHRPRRWLGPWPLAVPTRASPQCLTRTHAPQSGCMAVLGYRCTAFNWGAISRPQASYTGLHPADARSKSEYSLTHSLTHPTDARSKSEYSLTHSLDNKRSLVTRALVAVKLRFMVYQNCHSPL